ncbi:unnamed protein product [Caenorhabditis bovis]|uniref:Flavin-containing monooxygenase n=1 Tax=Caenorhabditis bovis TaxID=2654633 RepID=A0A8S1EMW3_9PELO|nr:unnamed protein product [Caenorhabditis bovis]
MAEKKKILVIGAGASGLPCLRHSQFYPNVDVVCFEKSNDIGGLWNYKPYETELSSVMKSTVINTSKEMTAYSDFPPEDDMANFMHNTEMCRYLKNYAKHHGLLEYIKFNHSVNSIRRDENYAQNGKWIVNYTNEKRETKEEVFDGILLCSGHHAIPYIPKKWPGQDEFKGRIIHAHSYKDHKGYEDKITVVVGIGNSGGDCAVELSRISKQVYLVTRRGSWIFSRLAARGEPLDLSVNTKFSMDYLKFVPLPIVNFVLEQSLNAKFDHERYGLKPKHPVTAAHPTLNDELPNRIASGTVRVKPGIREFTENGIIFDDGSVVDHVDEVILATGYSFNFNIVEDGDLIKVKENDMDAYKYMFPVTTCDHNTIGIIGLVQPTGSIMPLSEMQARVFFEAFVGNIELPSKEEMQKDIDAKKEEMRNRYVASRRHTIQVNYLDYIHELGELIGANPNMKHLWTTDPRLAMKVYFGPCLPYAFRLNGPNPWEGARQAIMDSEFRTIRSTNPKLQRKSRN